MAQKINPHNELSKFPPTLEGLYRFLDSIVEDGFPYQYAEAMRYAIEQSEQTYEAMISTIKEWLHFTHPLPPKWDRSYHFTSQTFEWPTEQGQWGHFRSVEDVDLRGMTGSVNFWPRVVE